MYRLFVWQGYGSGGAARITRAVAGYAAEQGVNVTIGLFTLDPTSSLPQIVIPTPRIIPSSFRSLAASIIFRIRYARRFDGVYAHTLGTWRLPGKHLFIHDAADLDEKIGSLPTLLTKTAYFLWRGLYVHFCLHRATLVLSATSAFTRYLKRYGIAQGKIVRSGSFYDDQVFRYIRRNPPTPPYSLLFIGDYTDPAKGFQRLLREVQGNARYHLHVAGGPPHLSEANITYHGTVSPLQLAQLLTDADIFVTLSRSEGFSIALLEALATGIPCLVTPAAAAEELTDIANLVRLDPLSSLHERITDITQNYTRYSQPAAGIEKYTEEAVLAREWAALCPYFAPAIPNRQRQHV